MDQVFITDLVARGIIGVNDWEREQPQDILINIVLFADLHQAGKVTTCLIAWITVRSRKKSGRTPKQPAG